MCTPGSSAPPHDLCRTPDRQSRPASAVRTKTPRSSPRQGTPSEILSASAPVASAALSSPACGGLIREGTTFRSTWDNAISSGQCAGLITIVQKHQPPSAGSRLLTFRNECKSRRFDPPDRQKILVPLLVESGQHLLNVGVRDSGCFVYEGNLQH